MNKKNIKIGILVSNINDLGGVEIVSIRLATAFEDEGIDATIFSCESVNSNELKSNVTVVNLGIQSGNYNINDIKIISNEIIKSNIEALFIQLNDPFSDLANLDLFCRLKDHMKCYVVFHNSPKSFLSRYRYNNENYLIYFLKYLKTKLIYTRKSKNKVKRIDSLITSFISISNGNYEELYEHFGVKSLLIENFYKEFQTDEVDINAKNKTIAYLGRVQEVQKDIYFLLDVWKQSQIYLGWKFLIIGSGNTDDLKKYISDKKIENVEVLGPMVNDSIINVLKKNSILVLSSHFEGFPTVLVEAANTYNAIVTTRFDGYSNEIVKDGYNGFVVKKNKGKFKNKLILLMNDEEKLKEMQKKSKKMFNNYIKNIKIESWINLL